MDNQDEKFENLKIMIKDTINLSLTNEDVVIHRSEIGLSNEHLITLVQMITKKLREIEKEFGNLNCRM